LWLHPTGAGPASARTPPPNCWASRKAKPPAPSTAQVRSSVMSFKPRTLAQEPPCHVAPSR
jgi:hypothetical protein